MTPFETVSAIEHAKHYCNVCNDVWQLFDADPVLEITQRLTEEIDQITKAHQWIAENVHTNDTARALAVMYPAALGELLELVFTQDALEWLSLAVEVGSRYPADFQKGSDFEPDYLLQTRLRYARACLQVGNSNRAIAILNEGLNQAHSALSVRMMCDVLISIGQCYVYSDRPDLAVFELERALRLYGEAESRGSAPENLLFPLLSSLSQACSDLGKHRLAIKHARHALKVALGSTMKTNEILALLNMAFVYRHGSWLSSKRTLTRYLSSSLLFRLKVGRLYHASRYARTAMELAQASGVRKCEAQALSSIGSIDLLLNRVDSSIEGLSRALDIMAGEHDRPGEAGVLSDLGAAYRVAGRFTEAVACGTRCITLSRQMEQRKREAHELYQLGLVRFRLGDLDVARQNAQEALSISDEINAPFAKRIRVFLSHVDRIAATRR